MRQSLRKSIGCDEVFGEYVKSQLKTGETQALLVAKQRLPQLLAMSPVEVETLFHLVGQNKDITLKALSFTSVV